MSDREFENLKAYFERCRAFDWWWRYSDCYKTLEQGQRVQWGLEYAARHDPTKRAIFYAWQSHELGVLPEPQLNDFSGESGYRCLKCLRII